MSDLERVLVCNAYGDVIEGAKAEQDARSKSERSVKVTAPGYRRRYVFLDHSSETADVVMLKFDLDLSTGAGHVFEALRNEITGSKTHPYRVNEALSWAWGTISFRLEALA